MTVLRLVLFVLLMAMAMTAIGQQHSPQQAVAPPASCPVTVPPAIPFIPPSPYPSELGDSFWLGTEKLWIDRPNSGTWDQWRPHEPGSEHLVQPLTVKTFWWSADYDPHIEGNPDLKVTGRRLDGEAPPLLTMKATNAFPSPATAMLVGVYVPAPGCWEITGEYKDQKLSFVVWVTPRILRSVK